HDYGEGRVEGGRDTVGEVLGDIQEWRLDPEVSVERLQEVDDHEEDGRHGKPESHEGQVLADEVAVDDVRRVTCRVGPVEPTVARGAARLAAGERVQRAPQERQRLAGPL